MRPIAMTRWCSVLLLAVVGCTSPTTQTQPTEPPSAQTTSEAALQPTAAPSASEDTDATPPPWKDTAIAYLDRRSAAWLASPPRSGQRVKCALSCHTTFTYALARPALGKSTTMDDLEKRLRARVAFDGHWKAQTPYYGKDGSSKAKESLGTEAVLNAVSLAMLDEQRGQAMQPTTRRAIERMWEIQRDDGGFDWLDFAFEPWEAGNESWGAAMAALAAGFLPKAEQNGAPIERLRSFLRERMQKMNAHDKLTLVWAATKLDGLMSAGDVRSTLDAVRGTQQGGGWSNAALIGSREGDEIDAYATALATWVACGNAPDHPSTLRGLAWLRKNQGSDGAWATPSANGDSRRGATFMTDAATAFATMALRKCSTH